jgi:hypothetical protein
MRVLALSLLAGALFLSVPSSIAAGGSPPTNGAFIAHDYSWDAQGGGHTVTISPGGTVTFSYPTGFSQHNADFTSGNPSSCVQTAGISNGSVPPLPHQPAAPPWSGSCTFKVPGTYNFKCDLHPYMTGTVKVLASGTSPPSSPLAGTQAQAVHVAKTQSGFSVRGSVSVSAAGAGGKLIATLQARASDLGGRGSGEVTAGRTSVKLHPGRVGFSISLNGSAKRALKRRGRLALKVKLEVRGRSGQTVHATRAVTLRR